MISLNLRSVAIRPKWSVTNSSISLHVNIHTLARLEEALEMVLVIISFPSVSLGYESTVVELLSRKEFGGRCLFLTYTVALEIRD